MKLESTEILEISFFLYIIWFIQMYRKKMLVESLTIPLMYMYMKNRKCQLQMNHKHWTNYELYYTMITIITWYFTSFLSLPRLACTANFCSRLDAFSTVFGSQSLARISSLSLFFSCSSLSTFCCSFISPEASWKEIVWKCWILKSTLISTFFTFDYMLTH